eukprot:CAMPEP_0174822096 /NCGR_PEP_ID=MMETSP1107-20130205/13199_1 /TAXON_ID=36770 /ORGANISM="Paraphysomonas vestita, Strain GFlagA" /LENGTH=122 /DNA_ID=CAMNT_0016040115 /DNA_START=218 /DNA_END=586 /DNA_ORIENTATION=-
MGMTIGKDNQFANPNTVDEPVVPSPIASNNNHNNSGRRTKLHPEVPNSPNGRTPVLNFVIEDEDDEEDDRFFGKNGPTRKSQEAKEHHIKEYEESKANGTLVTDISSNKKTWVAEIIDLENE